MPKKIYLPIQSRMTPAAKATGRNLDEITLNPEDTVQHSKHLSSLVMH